MNRPAEQVQQQLSPQQRQMQNQITQQKILRAIQGGIQFLTDETVNAPIKYSDGIVDLKWLLRALASGEFGIDTDPNGLQGAPVSLKPLSPPPTPGANGEGSPSE